MTRLLVAVRTVLEGTVLDAWHAGFTAAGLLPHLCLLSAPGPAMCRLPVSKNAGRTTRIDIT